MRLQLGEHGRLHGAIGDEQEQPEVQRLVRHGAYPCRSPKFVLDWSDIRTKDPWGAKVDEAYWSAVTQMRLTVATLLDGLAPDEWDQPSLCPDWRVRDVAGHLSLVPR